MNDSKNSTASVAQNTKKLFAKTDENDLSRRILMNKIGKVFWYVFRLLLLIGLGFVIIYPMLRTISRTFTPVEQYSDQSVIWIPKSLTISNILMAIEAMDYWRTLGRTIALSVGSAALQVISCSLVGYGFAKFRFKLNGPLFALVLLTIIIPSQLTFIPTYTQFRFFDFFGISHLIGLLVPGKDYTDFTVNLLNSNLPFYLTSLFGVGIRSGLFIYIYRQFYKGIPRELDEAASIDGCGVFSTYLRIMVPNTKATSITVFLFSVVWHWNEYTLTNTYFKTGNKPLSVVIQSVQEAARSVAAVGNAEAVNDAQIANGIAFASVILFLIPPIILYVFAQRFFVQGIESSGIKD